MHLRIVKAQRQGNPARVPPLRGGLSRERAKRAARRVQSRPQGRPAGAIASTRTKGGRSGLRDEMGLFRRVECQALAKPLPTGEPL